MRSGQGREKGRSGRGERESTSGSPGTSDEPNLPLSGDAFKILRDGGRVRKILIFERLLGPAKIFSQFQTSPSFRFSQFQFQMERERQKVNKCRLTWAPSYLLPVSDSAESALVQLEYLS